MSNEALTAVAKADIRPSGRKFVAMALADYADEEWSCFPSVAQLASYTSQGEKTVRDHLDALDEAGIISRDRHRRDDGTLGRYRFKLQRRNLPVVNQRRISPAADFARGEKHPEPAADFATHNPQREPPVSSSARDDSGFDQFWSIYPNKVGKPIARQKFSKALRKASLQAILSGLERYVAKTDDRAWCNPATWLHQERWDDQPAAPVARGSPSPNRPPTAQEILKARRQEIASHDDRSPDSPRLIAAR